MAQIPADFTDQLCAIVGQDKVLTDTGECWTYGYDNSRRHHPPQAVVFARDHDEVQAIVQLCHRRLVPLVARGRGSNTAGGTVPVAGGLVLSLERMSDILHVDPDNRVMHVQPGVTNAAVQAAAKEHNLFWPPDPSSSGFCTVGGNLGMNAAGPRAVKYGSTREHVLGLRAVTGEGEDIHTGVYTTKGVVGYDLTRLLIGSEGTLAVITEALLKLTPLPETVVTVQALYASIHDAAEAVTRIMRLPLTPCALEFMDAAAIDLVREFNPSLGNEEIGAMLMIEMDGPASAMEAAVDALRTTAGPGGLLQFTVARTEEEVRELWAMRKALSPALRKRAPNKLNEDVVVPVTRIPALIKGLERLSREYGIPIVNFGHAGNGNIHVNLLYDTQDERQAQNARPCVRKVFELVLDLGGTLSGEHGIGRERRDYVGMEIEKPVLDLMWGIKQRFDPRGILNPGKVFPPEYRSPRTD